MVRMYAFSRIYQYGAGGRPAAGTSIPGVSSLQLGGVYNLTDWSVKVDVK